MKKRFLIVLSAMLIFGLVAAAFAYNRSNNKALENSAVACPLMNKQAVSSGEKDSCGMAGCCKDGICSMGGACCKNGDSCPMKGESKTENDGAMANETAAATGESCCYKGAACCTGGACCMKRKS